MYPIKLDRGQAASRYGKPFVSAMMRDTYTVTMDEKQDRIALQVKAIRDEHVTPFVNEWVYVIHDGGHRTKVGRTYSPRSRYNSLCSNSPVALHFHGALVFGHGGAAVCEKAVHRKLSAAGHHSKGEWFDTPPDYAFSIVKQLAPKSLGVTDLRGAYDRCEAMMPIFESIARDDEPRIIKARKGREDFKWVMQHLELIGA